MKLARLFKLQDGKCFYCKIDVIPVFPGQRKQNDDSATRDHIIPKSRITYDSSKYINHNTIMACAKCNRKRGDMDFIDFMVISGYFKNE